MKQKWFYPIQQIAFQKLDALFIDRTCMFQTVSRDRVIEQHHCWRDNGTDYAQAVQVLVHMIKREDGNHTLLISELTLIASD